MLSQINVPIKFYLPTQNDYFYTIFASVSNEKPFKKDFTSICFFPGNLNDVRLIKPSLVATFIEDLSITTLPISS